MKRLDCLSDVRHDGEVPARGYDRRLDAWDYSSRTVCPCNQADMVPRASKRGVNLSRVNRIATMCAQIDIEREKQDVHFPSHSEKGDK